jgi:hypothetical protein
MAVCGPSAVAACLRIVVHVVSHPQHGEAIIPRAEFVLGEREMVAGNWLEIVFF